MRKFKWISPILLFAITSCASPVTEEENIPGEELTINDYQVEELVVDTTSDLFVLKLNSYIDISNYIEGGLLYGAVTNFLNLITEDGTVDINSNAYDLMSNMFHEGQVSFHRNRVAEARSFQSLEPSFGYSDVYIVPVLDYLDALHDLMFIEIRDYFYINRTWENGNSDGGFILRERLLSYEDAVFDAFDIFLPHFQELSLSQMGADLTFFEEDGLWIHFYALSIALEFIHVSNYLNDLEVSTAVNLRTKYDNLSNFIERFSEIYYDEQSQQFEGFSDFAINSGLPNLVNSSTLGLNMLLGIIETIESAGAPTQSSIDGFMQMADHIITSYNNLIN